MRGYKLLVWGSIVVSASPLVPVWYSVVASAADRPAAAAAAAPGTKPVSLNTVPEDGAGNDDIPASSRLVRDILVQRSNEDLIICIAGCRPGADRVVYSQPADPVPAKVTPVAETQPAQMPPPAVEAAKDAAKADPPAASEAAAGDSKGHMEPTAAPTDTLGPNSGPPAEAERPSEAPPAEQPAEQPSEEAPSEQPPPGPAEGDGQ